MTDRHVRWHPDVQVAEFTASAEHSSTAQPEDAAPLARILKSRKQRQDAYTTFALAYAIFLDDVRAKDVATGSPVRSVVGLRGRIQAIEHAAEVEESPRRDYYRYGFYLRMRFATGFPEMFQSLFWDRHFAPYVRRGLTQADLWDLLRDRAPARTALAPLRDSTNRQDRPRATPHPKKTQGYADRFRSKGTPAAQTAAP